MAMAMAEAATTQHQASRTTLACVAAFVCAWSMIGNANAATNAVPEPITLTEQQLATPEGQALARAQDALRTGDVNDVEVQLERARELVGLTVAACGTKDINVSRALNNLALLQAASGDYGAAVENFRAAIASRELLGATLVADALINPLLGLGDTLMAMEEEEAAKAVYERAIHVTHVNEGPANVSQVPIIDALYEVYEAMGDGRESARMQELRFRLLQRHYEPTSDQFIDALEQRAQWARRIDNDELAAQSYARMITRIGERFGEDDPRLIDPLMQFAVVSIGRESGRFARTEAGLLNEARRSVNRAERIARDRAETQPDLLARTLVRMGDW